MDQGGPDERRRDLSPLVHPRDEPEELAIKGHGYFICAVIAYFDFFPVIRPARTGYFKGDCLPACTIYLCTMSLLLLLLLLHLLLPPPPPAPLSRCSPHRLAVSLRPGVFRWFSSGPRTKVKHRSIFSGVHGRTSVINSGMPPRAYFKPVIGHCLLTVMFRDKLRF